MHCNLSIDKSIQMQTMCTTDLPICKSTPTPNKVHHQNTNTILAAAACCALLLLVMFILALERSWNSKEQASDRGAQDAHLLQPSIHSCEKNIGAACAPETLCIQRDSEPKRALLTSGRESRSVKIPSDEVMKCV